MDEVKKIGQHIGGYSVHNIDFFYYHLFNFHMTKTDTGQTTSNGRDNTLIIILFYFFKLFFLS
jgi:hypothetical protein